MSISFEAWTLPHLGTMTKVAAPLAVNEGSYQRGLNGVGTGRVVLKGDDPDIANVCDPANDVQTIIRVIEDGEVVFSFFARRIAREYDPEATVEISGPGIEAALDQAIVYPYDWAGTGLAGGSFPDSETTGVSVFPDTIYGGDNLLANPGFDVSKSNEVQQVWHDYRYATTLNGAITDTDTTIVVTDGSGLPTSSFRIVIGSEWIDVGTRSGNTLSSCVRGQYGTTATGHSDLTAVEGGGKFTLTFDGQTTSQLDWNATAAEVEAALIALSNIVDVDVTGSGNYGANFDPWLIEFIDPGAQDVALMTYTDVSLTSGTFFKIAVYIGGGKGIYDPWTKSLNPNTGVEHGGYDVFATGTSPVHGGTDSLGINPNGDGPDPYPGAQQIVPVTAGGVYQAAGWFYPITNSVECAIVIRDLNENLIAKTTQVCSPGTWTELTVDDIVIPTGVSQVIFRVATISNTTTTFWVDDMVFAEGLQAATPGQIVQDLWTAANSLQGRSILTWLKHDSFDGTNDSDSVAWPDNVSLILSAGMTWLQALDAIASLGYEWNVEWNSGAGQYELTLYNQGGLGTDRSADDAPGIRGDRVRYADALAQEPGANTYLGEGDSSLVAEDQDAALAAAYGRREGYLTGHDLEDLTTLGLALQHRLSEDSLRRSAFKAIVDDRIRVGRNLEVQLGDVVKAYLPPLINSAIDSRVVAYTVLLAPDGEITRQLDFDRQTYREKKGGTTSTATSQAVNWLLRRFQRVERTVAANASVANLVPTAATGGSGKDEFTAWGELVTFTGGQKLSFEYGATINRVVFRLGAASAGAAIQVDIIKNGADSIFGGPVTIGIGVDYLVATPLSSEQGLNAGDYLTCDVVQVGTSYPGSDLVATVDWTGTGGS